MVSHIDKWIRIYDIPETSQHKKGFTIYKIISMLYPEKSPDAVTKITVWKRYNEFKKLHRELKTKHRSLRFGDKFPLLPAHPFFKRFNEDVIKERKIAILIFLEYIAKQPDLFTSDVFVKFFESSHMPSNLINGSINSIRADLHLPCEPEIFSFSSNNSDDEYTLSDTDSISTLSSLSSSVQAVDLLADPMKKSTISLTKLCKKVNPETLTPVSEHMSVETLTNEFVPSLSPDTLSVHSAEFSNGYIVEAADYITKATEMELQKDYENAFSSYKQGIDILLSNVKYDTNLDRRGKVRFKIERYLLRAEKIYNVYLSPEIKQINELSKPEVQTTIERPLTELYKYKAIKIIESGMLVIHTETQELFFVKVIHKTWKYSSDYLILPNNVPYMIKLHNYYDCENAIFLILQYCCGIKLMDHIKNISTSKEEEHNGQSVESDNESEGTYSDLINDYTASKVQIMAKKNEEDHQDNDISALTNLSEREEKNSNDADDSYLNDKDSSNLKIDSMLFKSQKLLSTIEEALSKEVVVSDLTSKKDDSKVIRINDVYERQLSDKSINDEFDFQQINANVEDIVKWAAQLLLALEKLHALGVVCCDLNLNNLLIDGNGDLLLTYMCSVSEEKTFKDNADLYLAPELFGFNNNKICSAADWWSYGTILYELLVGLPLKSVHPEGITSYMTLKIPKYVLPEGRSLLKQLLVYESSERLGCGANGTEDIKTHPFFNSVSWDYLFSKYI